MICQLSNLIIGLGRGIESATNPMGTGVLRSGKRSAYVFGYWRRLGARQRQDFVALKRSRKAVTLLELRRRKPAFTVTYLDSQEEDRGQIVRGGFGEGKLGTCVHYGSTLIRNWFQHLSETDLLRTDNRF
jgi:hypothetical protein